MKISELLTLTEMELNNLRITDEVERVANKYNLTQRDLELLYTWDEKTQRGQTKLYQENIEDFLNLAKKVNMPYSRPTYRGKVLIPEAVLQLVTKGKVTLKPLMVSESWGTDFDLAKMFLYHRLDSGHPRVPKPGEGILIEKKFSPNEQILWVKNPKLLSIVKELGLRLLLRQITDEEEVLIKRDKSYTITLKDIRLFTARDEKIKQAISKKWPNINIEGSAYYLENGEVVRTR